MTPKAHSKKEKKKGKLGYMHDRVDVPIRRERDTRDHSLPVSTEERPCGDIVRKWMSTSWEESPHYILNLLAPWLWTYSLQNCEEINIYCLTDPISSILPWQPEQTNVPPKIRNNTRMSALVTACQNCIGNSSQQN